MNDCCGMTKSLAEFSARLFYAVNSKTTIVLLGVFVYAEVVEKCKKSVQIFELIP